jgi:hypothetical protein
MGARASERIIMGCRSLVAFAAIAGSCIIGCSSASPRTNAPSSSSSPGVVTIVIERGAQDDSGYWVANASVDDEHVVRAVEKNPIVGMTLDDREHRLVAQVDFHPKNVVAVSTFRAHDVHRFAVGPGCTLEVHVGAEVKADGLPRVTFRDALACADAAGAARSIPEPRMLAAPHDDDAQDLLRYYAEAHELVADADRYVELAFVAARKIGDASVVAALANELAQIRSEKRTLDDRAPLGIEASLAEAKVAADAARASVDRVTALQRQARESAPASD